MLRFLTNTFQLARQAAHAWLELDLPRMGAALAFHTLFAVAPLFVILLALAGFWFGEEAARRELSSQISGLVGNTAGDAIQAVVGAAHREKTGAWATVIAATVLFVNATGVFVHLRGALNSIWGVQRLPGRGLRNLIKDRLLSFVMILGMASVLLGSLALSTWQSSMNRFIGGLLPAEGGAWQAINFVVSFGVITLLFAMMFKVLPDVRVAWRDVWIGAIITTLLFNLGKFLFGLYLGWSTITSAYGAAGSLVITLLWVYYSAQIMLFGAKFTQLYANAYGSRREASYGAKASPLESPGSAEPQPRLMCVAPQEEAP